MNEKHNAIKNPKTEKEIDEAIKQLFLPDKPTSLAHHKSNQFLFGDDYYQHFFAKDSHHEQ